MTLTLYHCKDARSLRPLWCLEEMELPYELVTLPFPPRVFAKEYKDINPLGTIPYLIDGDTRMSESTGICHYLTNSYGPTDLALTPDHSDYGAFLNWLYFSDATLTFPQTLVLRYSVLEPEERRLPQAAEDYAKWFSGRLRHVEAALEGKDFLVADRFTIADIAIGYALFLASTLKPLAPLLTPNCLRYLHALKARDGFKRAQDAQST
ncbi:glutathione S-transferase family protein [Hyphomonas sp. FCG-A18]|uniref:glutathione S-transferase family protein n=1 Tax=Hyphomonas sp. FCG-A18 TaxID=3080019 RepID=UPI002B28619D|nr:glutathione S-transferase family protein [Hyphomonas sp. FCG-A18]